MSVDRVTPPPGPRGRPAGVLRPVTALVGSAGRLRTVEVAGLPVAVTTMADSVAWLTDWLEVGRGGLSVRLVNAYSIVSAYRDPTYFDLMSGSGVSLPDGTPITLVQRLLRRDRTAGRVRGPSFFMRILESTQHDGTRHFFLGTTPGTLQLLRTRAMQLWPALTIAGTYAPPFGRPHAEYLEECVRQVKASGADCVWVALGTPKQDFVAARLASRVDVPCIAVGAAFDFLAGTKAQAPRWMQAIGAEWLHRLVTEPRRLWRRYLIGNLQFLYLVVRHGRPPRTLHRA